MNKQILEFSRRQSLAGLSFLGLSGLLLPAAYAQKKSHQTTGVGLSEKPASTTKISSPLR